MDKNYPNATLHLFNYKHSQFIFDGNQLRLIKVDKEFSDNIESNMKQIAQVLSDSTEQSIQPSPRTNDMLMMLLNVSHACNFSCKYCFAQNLNSYCSSFITRQDKKVDALMTEETARKSVDFLLNTAVDFKVNSILIAFFGGEPLENFPVIEETVLYAETVAKNNGLHLFFNLGTNGSLLADDKITFFKKHNFKLTISIDGKKEIHNKNRIFSDGSGTYDVIINKASNAINALPFVGASLTLTNGNKIFESYLHLEELGFKEVIASPVVTQDAELKLTQENLTQLIDGEIRLIEYIFSNFCSPNQPAMYSVLNNDILPPLITKKPKVRYCDAGFRLFSVSVNGDVYPCGNFVGIDEFKMCNVEDSKSLETTRVHKIFSNATVNRRENCGQCWARYVCGGGCYYSAYIKHKKIHIKDEQNCDRMKRLIESVSGELSEVLDQQPITQK